MGTPETATITSTQGKLGGLVALRDTTIPGYQTTLNTIAHTLIVQTNALQAGGTDVNGVVRRLTVAQYRNTLRELLRLEDNLADVLPPDAVSRDGFVNNRETLQLSPLLLEAYLDIAEKALDRCVVDPRARPAAAPSWPRRSGPSWP